MSPNNCTPRNRHKTIENILKQTLYIHVHSTTLHNS